MNIQTKIDAKPDSRIDVRHSTCPHDCPSACALDIEVVGGTTIGRVRGSKQQSYTAGVICAKVARYAERIHHPERLMHPMRRTVRKAPGSSRKSPGTRRSTRSPRSSTQPNATSARNRFGPITTPARWGW